MAEHSAQGFTYGGLCRWTGSGHLNSDCGRGGDSVCCGDCDGATIGAVADKQVSRALETQVPQSDRENGNSDSEGNYGESSEQPRMVRVDKSLSWIVLTLF